jgi:hypothetical protein
MTTIAMGAGMMPIALGLGVDPSFRAPMAIVVIGGLITSTFLSLLVIPVVFTFVDDLVQWVGRRTGAAMPRARCRRRLGSNLLRWSPPATWRCPSTAAGGGAAGGRVRTRSSIEDISTLLLAGEFAYKLRKPVALPFLDFTTLAARARLRGRAAPEPAHRAAALPRRAAGAERSRSRASVNPARPAARSTGCCACAASTTNCCSTASPRVAHSPRPTSTRWRGASPTHAAAGLAGDYGDPAACSPGRANFAALGEAVEDLHDWSARIRAHRTASPAPPPGPRRGHGDLHLGNIVKLDGEPRLRRDRVQPGAAPWRHHGRRRLRLHGPVAPRPARARLAFRQRLGRARR